MKKILALALALMMTTANFALADKDSADITAQGTATVSAVPDIVSVTANASVQGNTVGAAQEQMSRIVADVTAKLIELGAEQEDIVTTNYSFHPIYNYEAATPTVTGYQGNHTLSVTCKDVDMLDSVLGVMTDSGMTEIYDVSYDVSNRQALYSEALALAVANAQGKAQTMAAATGMTIDGLEEIRENDSYSLGYYSERALASGAQADTVSTGIRAGSVSVTANVTAVYEASAK